MQSTFETHERTRIRFVENEIALAQTFLDVAHIEANEPSVANHARSAAQEGYVTALSNVKAIRDVDEWQRLMAKIFNLKERLDACPPAVGS